MDISGRLTSVLKDVICDIVKDKDVAIAFSGGLDCGIVAAVAKNYARSITLYTVGVDDAYDVKESDETSRILGLQWVHLPMNEEDLEICIKDMISVTGTVDTITLSFEVPLYYVSKNCKENIIIGGQGADELFAGYSKYEGLSKEEFTEQRNKDIARLMNTTLHHERSVCEHFNRIIRYPYLDERVMDIVKGMDVKELMPGDTRKKILREVAYSIQQPEIAAKKKKAAQYGSGAMELIRKIAKKKGMTVNEMIAEWSDGRE